MVSASWLMACAEVITVKYGEGEAIIGGDAVENVKISVKGNRVSIKDQRDAEKKLSPLTYVLSGQTDDGQFKLNSYAKAKVRLNGLSLTSQEGAAMHLKNKKDIELEVADGTFNRICIAACLDTLNNKQAAIWAKQSVNFSGKGTLAVEALGNGCKGINCKGDINIRNLTLQVVTKGDNLGVDTTRRMGPPDGEFPGQPNGKFPGPPMGFTGQQNGMQGPPMGDMGGGMPGGKQKYISTCKGIKAKGKLTILSGTVSVETNSNGAEGIEGKEGVTISGGKVSVNAVDDGINSGGKIIFAGGETTVVSTTNDAVDSNDGESKGGFPFMHEGAEQEPMGQNSTAHDEKETEPAIIIRGGTVYAWSRRGAPEEGLDCDFAPIEVSGGTVFSIGAGMGDMPSVPTNKTAKQPTVLAIGLNFTEGETVSIQDRKGKTLMAFPAPFDFQRSSSLISCPAFRVGETYTVVCGQESKSMELTDKFTIIR